MYSRRKKRSDKKHLTEKWKAHNGGSVKNENKNKNVQSFIVPDEPVQVKYHAQA